MATSSSSSPADHVLLELLHAAQESSCSNTSSSSTSSNSNLDILRSIVLKALSEPDLFYGYQQLARIIQQQQHAKSTNNTTATSTTSTTATTSSSNSNNETTSTAAATTTAERVLIQTLNLFSYGTYLDYEQNPSLYLRLSDTQIYKLRQLTIMTLVQQQTSSNNNTAGRAAVGGGCRIPYTELERALGFPSSSSSSSSASTASSPNNNTMATDENISNNKSSNSSSTTTTTIFNNSTRQVEEIVTSCLYAGVVNGKLCQKTKSFHVMPMTAAATAEKSSLKSAGSDTTAVPALRSANTTCRDINMDTDISKMLLQIQQLQNALQTSHDTLTQEQTEWTRSWQDTEMNHLRLTQELESNQKSGVGGGGRGGNNNNATSIDAGAGGGAGGRRQKRSRGGFGGGGAAAGAGASGGGGGNMGDNNNPPSPFLGRFHL